MSMVIEQARLADAQSVLDLLQRSHLPVDGVSNCLSTAVVARENGQIIGSAALEVGDHCAAAAAEPPRPTPCTRRDGERGRAPAGFGRTARRRSPTHAWRRSPLTRTKE